MINLKNKTVKTLFILLGGAIGAFAFPPYNLTILGLLSYGLLFIFVKRAANCKQAMFVSGLWSISFFVSGLWWIAQALLVEGNPFWWAYPIAVLGLPALLSVFHIVSSAIFKKIERTFELDLIISGALFALIFATSEYLRGNLFTGFPWNLPAYIWSDHLTILQTLSWAGPYGLSLMTIVLSVSIAALTLECSKKSSIVALVVVTAFLSLHFWGGNRLHNASVTNNTSSNTLVRVVQPNIKQEDKWNPNLYSEHLSTLQRLSISPLPDEDFDTVLLIFPETAINDVMMSSDSAREAFASITKHYKEKGKVVYILTGALRSHVSLDGGVGYYNSALLYDDKGYIIDDYDKSHLVPFGEYMPLSDVLDIAPIVGFSGFQKGDGPTTIHKKGIPSMGVAICYELIFPKKLINQSDRPELIVTITNDGWYGNTPGPYQHHMMARYRAIEEETPVLRAANTGVSGGFDSFGRSLGRIEVNDFGVIDSLL